MIRKAISPGSEAVHFPRLGFDAVRDFEMTAGSAQIMWPDARFCKFQGVGSAHAKILTIARRGDAIPVAEHVAMTGNAVISAITVSNVGLWRGVVILARVTADAGSCGTDFAFRSLEIIPVFWLCISDLGIGFDARRHRFRRSKGSNPTARIG